MRTKRRLTVRHEKLEYPTSTTYFIAGRQTYSTKILSYETRSFTRQEFVENLLTLASNWFLLLRLKVNAS